MLADYEEYAAAVKVATGGGAYCPSGGGGGAFSLALICPTGEDVGEGTAAGAAGGGAHNHALSAISGLLATVTASVVVTPPPIPGASMQSPAVAGGSQAMYHHQVTGAAKSDSIALVVTDWADQMLVGLLDYEVLSSALGAQGVPWSVHLQTLFQMVRKGEWAITYPYTPGDGGDSPRQSQGRKHHAHPSAATPMSPASRGKIDIQAKGPVPFLWQCTLVPIVNKEKRMTLNGQVGRSLMRLHTVAVAMFEREKKDRQDAEDMLTRAYATGGVPDLKKNAATKQGAGSSPEKKKPQSLLNPGQKGPVGMKKPRGVKIG